MTEPVDHRSRSRRAARVVGWPFRTVLIWMISAYRIAISPLLGPRCRFHPTCSAYALDSIRVHGAAKGTALLTWRLLRCSPLTRGGYDPVPAPGRWRPDVLPDGRPRHNQHVDADRHSHHASKEA